MTSTAKQAVKDVIRERRLARMRMGSAVCTYATLTSDPEVRVAMVPISDIERENALIEAASLDVPENAAGYLARDHKQRTATLAFAVRDPENLSERVYMTASELQSELDGNDIDMLYDEYQEMVALGSPALDQIPPEEFDALKELWQTVEWNALSGRSWYAAKRFLGALIQDGQLPANFLGSQSTKELTTTNE